MLFRGGGKLSISNFRDTRMTDLAQLKIRSAVDLLLQSAHPLHTHTHTPLPVSEW
jgi:hypothetical protein